MLSLRPQHLKRYKDLAWLLMKYGRSDIVRQAGLERVLDDGAPAAADVRNQAEELVRDLERMGPAFVKLGQILSTRPDILPQAYLDALVRLQDHVEPFAFAEVERIVTEELGKELSWAFSSFERTPVASASLAQVHRGTLRDGRLVAVKVQRPNVRSVVARDLHVLQELAAFLDGHTDVGRRYEFVRLVATLRRVLTGELDYRNEARNYKTLRRNLREFPGILVPRAIDEYTTSRVLTMDLVRGEKIPSLCAETLAEVDGPALADELFSAYLKQVLVDGFFHADPHPGNVFLTQDRRLAILDLGMTVRVPPRLQEQFVRLLLAISEGEGEECAAIAIKMGQARREFNKHDFRHDISRLVTENRDASISQIPLGRVVLEIQRAAGENGFRLPPEFTMLGKAFMNLDDVLKTLHPGFNLVEAMRRRETEIMRHHTGVRLSVGRLYESLLEVNELVQMAPQRLNRVMELLAENELRVRVDAVDEQELIRGIQKVANRIAAGAVVAALVIGASIIMHVETDLTIFGYPALAMAFFVVAALGGAALVYESLFYDR